LDPVPGRHWTANILIRYVPRFPGSCEYPRCLTIMLHPSGDSLKQSRGVQSTVGESSIPSASFHNASTPSLPVTRSNVPPAMRSTSYAEDLYSKYPLSSSRRSESRTSLMIPGSSPSTSPASGRSSPPQRQGRSLLKPGAEGKLLVPDVKMKVHAGTSLSPSVASSASLASWGSSYPASSRRSVRSPLSRHSSEISEGGMSDQHTNSDADEWLMAKRPTVESKHPLPYS